MSKPPVSPERTIGQGVGLADALMAGAAAGDQEAMFALAEETARECPEAIAAVAVLLATHLHEANAVCLRAAVAFDELSDRVDRITAAAG